MRDAGRWPDDALRPLTARGLRRFRDVVDGLRALLPTPERLLTSPYQRATQTAEVLTTKNAWPGSIEVPSLAGDDIEAQLAELRRQARDLAGALAVVGHQPGLGHLASWLLSGDDEGVAFDWRKGGAAILSLDRFEAGEARLDGFYSPRSLRAIARHTATKVVGC